MQEFPKLNKIRETVVGISTFILVLILFFLGIQAVGKERIEGIVIQAGAFGPLILALLKAASVVWAPLLGGPVYLIGGTLYGLWGGTIYTLVGDLVGGSVAFWISRRYGQAVVIKLAGKDILNRLEKLYNTLGGWKGLLSARLFIPGIQDVISYGAGFTPIPFWQFFVVTAVGSFLPNMLLVAVGTILVERSSEVLRLYGSIAVIYFALAGTYLYIRNRNQKKKLDKGTNG